MAQQWFVRQGDKVVGPLSAAQLKKNADAGRIKPSTRLRLGTDGKWIPASSIKGLLPSTDASTTPSTEAKNTAPASPLPLDDDVLKDAADTSELTLQPIDEVPARTTTASRKTERQQRPPNPLLSTAVQVGKALLVVLAITCIIVLFWWWASNRPHYTFEGLQVEIYNTTLSKPGKPFSVDVSDLRHRLLSRKDKMNSVPTRHTRTIIKHGITMKIVHEKDGLMRAEIVTGKGVINIDARMYREKGVRHYLKVLKVAVDGREIGRSIY